MNCLYHFCAQTQGLPGELKYTHGVIETHKKIETQEEYKQVREQIANEAGVLVHRVIVNSLSLLNP